METEKKRTGRGYLGGNIMILPSCHYGRTLLLSTRDKARISTLSHLPEDHMAGFLHLDDAKDSGWQPDNEDCNMKFLRALPPSCLGKLEIDVEGWFSYVQSSCCFPPAPTHSAFISAASTNSKWSTADSKCQPSSVSYTTTSSSADASGNVLENVLHSFVAESDPQQQITYEDFDQIGKLDLEELDIKWQMAMLSVRINRFEKKAGRKFKFNNKDAARFDKKKVRCYQCSELGHFARECTGKKVDSKTRYSAFKIKELDKSEEPKALVSVDSMLNWSDHESEDMEKGASEVYGMIAGYGDDAVIPAVDAADGVSTDGILADGVSVAAGVGADGISVTSSDATDAETQFALMGLSPQAKLDNMNTKVKLEESEARPAYVPTGSRNRPTSVPAGRPFPAGWHNPAARPMTRPKSHYFQQFSRPAVYNLKWIWMGEDGEMLLRPQQVVLGKVNTPVMHWDPRSMWISTIYGVFHIDPQGRAQIKGGTVTFGGGDGKITGKGTIRTSNFNFENVYYVEELQNFNLFSVSTNCDTKNKVLFTDKECLVLSKEFQLPDSSQGIKRDYSVARTPQQNGVAERKNRTLIEAARTMLVDSKLPTMFWTEAVSTACYVLNRVLVTRPHNKTPYELLSRKVPNISHLKPFGCHVTILNTSDHLGKFEGKADEGLLLGYSARTRSDLARYRVYNLSKTKDSRTRNLRYMEDKPNVQGLGHEWYFDLDYLTDSLGYTRFKSNQPAGTQDTNTHAGTHDDSDSECDEQVIVVPSFPSNQPFFSPKIEANSARQRDTWKIADTVPADSGVPATSIPAGRS
ncbi:putative ribonuclease H-like domain-containing protein [Tanacetum coccineum]|uniref:Ribonuclease H-like domain-containing protein n=1 Tax=Tanacetum coccineum TaxID=301880 RepID=A0ABQ5J8Q4_9ASTR